MSNESKVIYLDEQLPPVDKWVLFVIVVNNDESADNISISHDFGRRLDDGTLCTDYDWVGDPYDGKPYAIIGWTQLPQPCEAEILKHKLVWHNVSDNNDNYTTQEG